MKIFSRLLAFLLGVVVGIGSIVGAVAYAVTSVNLDWLKKMGIFDWEQSIEIDKDAEAPLNTLSLVKLIETLSKYGNGNISVDELEKTYGVNFDKIMNYKLPPQLKCLTLTQLMDVQNLGTHLTGLKAGVFIPTAKLGADGNYVSAENTPLPNAVANLDVGKTLDGVLKGDMFGMVKNSSLAPIQLKAIMPELEKFFADKTIGNLITTTGGVSSIDFMGVVGDIDLGSFVTQLAGIKISQLMDPNFNIADIIPAVLGGEYIGNAMQMKLKYEVSRKVTQSDIDGATPPLTRVMMPAPDSGAQVTVVVDNPDNTLPSVTYYKWVYTTIDTSVTPNVTTEKFYYTTDQNLTVGATDLYQTVWYKQDGVTKETDSITLTIAGIKVASLLDGSFKLNTIVESLQLGSILGYELKCTDTTPNHKHDANCWKDKNNNSPSGITAALVTLTGKDLLAGTFMDSLNTVKVGELLSLKYGKINPTDTKEVWYRQDASGNKTAATGIEATLADLTVGDLTGGGMMDKLNVIKLGELLGFTYDDVKKEWIKNGKPATGIEAALVELTIGDLTSGNFITKLDTVKVGDLMGYTTKYEICRKAIAEDINGATALVAVMIKPDNLLQETVVFNGVTYYKWSLTTVDSSVTPPVSTIKYYFTTTQTITVGTTDLYQVVWYNGDKKADGIFATLAGLTFGDLKGGNLMGSINSVKLGELLGFTYDETAKKWYKLNPDNSKKYASGIEAALVDVTVGDLTNGKLMSSLDNVKLGDLLGFTFDETAKKWYKLNADGHTKDYATGIEATLVTLTMKDFTGGTIMDSLNDVSIGDLMGYVLQYDKAFAATQTDISKLTAVMIKPDNLLQETVVFNGVTYYKWLYTTTDNTQSPPVVTTENYFTTTQTLSVGVEMFKAVWYKDGKVASGMFAALASVSVGDLKTGAIDKKLDAIKLGDFLGYTFENETGKWYKLESGAKKYAVGIDGALVKLTVADLKGDKLLSAFDTVQLGYVLGYTTNDDGKTWTKNGAAPTGVNAALVGLTIANLKTPSGLMDAVNTVKLGDILGYTFVCADATPSHKHNANCWLNGATAPSGIMGTIASMTVKDLSDPMVGINNIKLGDVLGYKYGEIVVGEGNVWYKENGGVKTAASGLDGAIVNLTISDLSNGDKLMQSVNKVKLGELLGYTYSELVTGKGKVWHKNNVEAEGIIGIVADMTIDTLTSKDSGINTIKLGKILGYKLTCVIPNHTHDATCWQDKTGKAPTGINGAIVNLTINDLSSGDKLMQSVNKVQLGELLGYTKNTTDGKWYKGTVEAESIIGIVADMTINSLTSPTEGINTIKIGKILGYTFVCTNVEPTHTHGAACWQDKTGKAPNGINGAIVNLTINQLSDGNTLMNSVNKVQLGELLGYTKNTTDGKWYKGTAEAEGIIGIVADMTINSLTSPTEGINTIKIGKILGYTFVCTNVEPTHTHGAACWQDKTGKAPNGINGAIVNLTINQLSDGNTLMNSVNKVQLGELLGYTKNVNGKWYKDGTAATGIIGIVADMTINSLTSPTEGINTIKLGKILGYENDNDGQGWYKLSGTTNKTYATGLDKAIADLAISDLSNGDALMTQVKTVKLGDLLGITSSEGIMGQLKDTPVGQINDKLSTLKLGDILGYTPRAAANGTVGDATIYTAVNGKKGTQMTLTIGGTVYYKWSTSTDSQYYYTTTSTIANGNPLFTVTWFNNNVEVKGIDKILADQDINNIDFTVMNKATMKDFIDAGALTIGGSETATLNSLLRGWQTLPLGEFVTALINSIPASADYATYSAWSSSGRLASKPSYTAVDNWWLNGTATGALPTNAPAATLEEFTAATNKNACFNKWLTQTGKTNTYDNYKLFLDYLTGLGL